MEQTYRVEKTPCQGPEPEQSSSSYSTEAPSVPSSPKSSLLSCLSYSSSSGTPPSTLYETASENTPSSAKAAYRPQPSSSVATIPGDLNPRQAHSPEDHHWDAPPEAVVDGLAAEAQRQNLIAMTHLPQIYTLNWLYDSDKSEGHDQETAGEDAEQVSVTSKASRRAEEVHTEEERREQIRERRMIFRAGLPTEPEALVSSFLTQVETTLMPEASVLSFPAQAETKLTTQTAGEVSRQVRRRMRYLTRLRKFFSRRSHERKNETRHNCTQQ